MIGPRRPNLLAAFIDLAFAIGAGFIGAFGFGWQHLIGLVLAHVVFWAISRQTTLKKTSRANLPGAVAVSVGIIAIVDAAAFLIASTFRG